MKRSVRLSLKRETLVALAGEELAFGAGVPDHTLEVRCWVALSPSLPPGCPLPTFHREAC